MIRPKRFKNLPPAKSSRNRRGDQKKTYERARGFLNKAAAGALTSSLLLTPATFAPLKKINMKSNKNKVIISRRQDDPLKLKEQKLKTNGALVKQLEQILPSRPKPLTSTQEEAISRVIHTSLQVLAVAQLGGKRLNAAFGTIGSEQHLRRFPGDIASKHDTFPNAGLAPRNGAWGLFAPSKKVLDKDLSQKEKYYFAVQTFLAPGWSNNSLILKDWFKYRKMIAVNPKTGQAVVGVVADAGPASWTGKQFGGSPEVIDALGFGISRHGDVLLFFVDDPQNKVPLGPLPKKG